MKVLVERKSFFFFVVSFDDQNFCEGSNMQLSCKQNKRLAIYSAQYGRTVNGQAMHCTPNTPVAKGWANSCLVSYLPFYLYISMILL